MLCGAYVVRRLQPGSASAPFLAFGATLSLALMLDDLFLLHEVVLPNVAGVDEFVIFPAYGAAALTWLAAYRRLLSPRALVPLVAAVAMFALMATIDIFLGGSNADWRLLSEDGAKLFGICAWAAFAVVSTEDARWDAVGSPPGT